MLTLLMGNLAAFIPQKNLTGAFLSLLQNTEVHDLTINPSLQTAFYLLSCPTEGKYRKKFSSYFTQMLGGQNSPCFGIFL